MSAKEIIQKWANETEKSLVENYNNMELRASGKWEKELSNEITELQKGFVIVFRGSKYTYWLENGRKRTKMKVGRKKATSELLTIIKQWIEDKGLTPEYGTKESMAYAITKKIHKKGIQVPNKYNSGGLVSNVITTKRVTQLIEELKGFHIRQLKTILNVNS